MKSTQIALASRPVGEPTDDSFETRVVDLPDVEDGQVLLRTVYLSLDPYMRGRMSAAKSYAAPVEIGDVMVGGTVCEVVESRHDGLPVGSTVLSYSGWQTHSVVSGDAVRKLDPSVAPISTALGVLGMPGFTAYAGLLEIGRPQPGETVVVAAATGPVGSAVGQIARLKGARAVGIAGGPDKVRALTEEFGFDAAHRPPRPGLRGTACRGHTRRHRRLLRERRRPGRRGSLPTAQQVRPRARSAGWSPTTTRPPRPRARTGSRH